MTQNFLASTLAVALLFTACGGGDSAEAPSANTESPAETPATDSSAAPPSESEVESSASFAEDPCAALDEAEVATVFGAEASAVSEENAPFYASGNSAACEWTLTHDGVESSVVLWAAMQGENAAPNAWADTIAGYIESGEQVGSRQLEHEAADLAGTGPGALSALHGGAYVKTRIYSWHQEQVLYRLTVSNSFADDGDDLPDPADGSLEPLVASIVG